MAEIVGDEGNGSGSVSQAAFISYLESVLGGEGTGTANKDVLEKSSGSTTSSSKQLEADNPDLAAALSVMWLASGNNPVMLQQISSGSLSSMGSGSVGALGGGGTAINAKLMILQIENAESAICVTMLTAWSKSIADEAKATRDELNSESHREYEEAQGKAGYEAWLNSLPLEQQIQVLNYPKMEKLEAIDKGVSQGLNDYLTHIKTTTDPSVAQDLPYMTAAVVMSGAMRFDYAATPISGSSSPILVEPLKVANDLIMQKMAPDQAPQVAYVGAMMMAGSSYLSLAQVLPKAGGQDKGEINYEFAKKYAENILNSVNGSGFNTMASALVTVSIDPGQPVTEERVQQLTTTLKVSLLSTALALLYKTESDAPEALIERYNLNRDVINSGGITGEEFKQMVSGNEGLLDTDAKKLIAGQIRDLLSELPPAEGSRLIASLSEFVDQARSSKQLIDVGALLDNIKFGSGVADGGVVV